MVVTCGFWKLATLIIVVVTVCYKRWWLSVADAVEAVVIGCGDDCIDGCCDCLLHVDADNMLL